MLRQVAQQGVHLAEACAVDQVAATRFGAHQAGVGELVSLATKRGREAKPGLKVGVCGEHGGDPRSIGFFHGVGLDYVSCSPFRVAVARLAAAHAALSGSGGVSSTA